MKAIVELTPPLKKVRQPREVTVAKLRAEIKELKAWNREIRKVMHKLNGELTDERAHTREMLRIARVEAFRAFERHMCCTCTPTRAEALARD
jgi:predicted RNase H-like nuclease (RuvC/YqgF family)